MWSSLSAPISFLMCANGISNGKFRPAFHDDCLVLMSEMNSSESGCSGLVAVAKAAQRSTAPAAIDGAMFGFVRDFIYG